MPHMLKPVWAVVTEIDESAVIVFILNVRGSSLALSIRVHFSKKIVK